MVGTCTLVHLGAAPVSLMPCGTSCAQMASTTHCTCQTTSPQHMHRGDGVSSTDMPAARVSTLLAELDSQFISEFDELAVDTASEAHHKQLMEASRRIRSWLGELEFIWGAAIGLIR